MLILGWGVMLEFVEVASGVHLFFASDKKAASALYPVSSILVCTICVHLKYATYFHILGSSPVC